MASVGVATGVGMLEGRGEDEGVAGGVEGGDAVVGERGGWSSRGVDGRDGGSGQRGSADDASARSITIAHST
jgi:hypothetical protein